MEWLHAHPTSSENFASKTLADPKSVYARITMANYYRKAIDGDTLPEEYKNSIRTLFLQKVFIYLIQNSHI